VSTAAALSALGESKTVFREVPGGVNAKETAPAADGSVAEGIATLPPDCWLLDCWLLGCWLLATATVNDCVAAEVPLLAVTTICTLPEKFAAVRSVN
jgi:hypothetical protein